MKIGYVCTNFNNSSFTVSAVNSLLANVGHDVFSVIVDNGSDDANRDILRDLAASARSVHVIFSPENVGYFRGLNLGIRYLRASHPDIEWMVIGNNDLEFPNNFAERLQQNVAKWKQYPVISPDIITIDGCHQNPHVISHISGIRELVYDVYFSNYYVGLLTQKLALALHRFSDRRDEEQWAIPQAIHQGHGSCYILGPVFFDHFEELWAPTFLMSEEFFLAKQLMGIDAQVYYDPAIKVTHHWHGAVGRLPNRRRWELSRSAHIEYRKYVKPFVWPSNRPTSPSP